MRLTLADITFHPALHHAFLVQPWVSLQGNNGLLQRTYGRVLGKATDNITFSAPNEPTHIRVTVGNARGKLYVSWNQGTASTGGAIKIATSSSMAGSTTTSATMMPLTLADVCEDSPAATSGFRSMGTQYTALVDVSAFAGRQVYYTVGDATDTSAVNTLKVPLAAGDASQFSFLIWADQGERSVGDTRAGRPICRG